MTDTQRVIVTETVIEAQTLTTIAELISTMTWTSYATTTIISTSTALERYPTTTTIAIPNYTGHYRSIASHLCGHQDTLFSTTCHEICRSAVANFRTWFPWLFVLLNLYGALFLLYYHHNRR